MKSDFLIYGLVIIASVILGMVIARQFSTMIYGILILGMIFLGLIAAHEINT